MPSQWQHVGQADVLGSRWSQASLSPLCVLFSVYSAENPIPTEVVQAEAELHSLVIT